VKILITTFTYPPNKDGVAEACRTMAEGLAGSGWDVWIATSMENFKRTASADVTPTGTIKITDFDFRHDPTNETAHDQEVGRYRDFVKEGGFDIIVNQCWEVPTTRYLQSILPTMKTKKIMVSHGYGVHVYTWQSRLTMGLGLWLRGLRFTVCKFPKLIRSYDRIIFLSSTKDMGRFFDHSLADWMRLSGIEIVANGVDLKPLEPTLGDFRETHDIGTAPMALCVANYCERKNQRLAIKCFRKANVPGSILVFIGSDLNDYGKGVRKLDQKLAASHPDCSVLFLEKISREETFAAFRECDFVLLTAIAETQPIVLIEAMAAGKPWISTNTGCVASLRGGIVCRRKSSLAPAIRRMLSDTNLCETLGAQGRQEAIMHYDATKNIQKFDSIFRELLRLPS
jgi:glycosyltransferase involved in cell wall biosynthesis